MYAGEQPCGCTAQHAKPASSPTCGEVHLAHEPKALQRARRGLDLVCLAARRHRSGRHIWVLGPNAVDRHGGAVEQHARVLYQQVVRQVQRGLVRWGDGVGERARQAGR